MSRVLDKNYGSLSQEEKLLVNTLAIFHSPVDQRTLSEIAGFFPFRENVHSRIHKELTGLCNMGMIQEWNTGEKTSRYSITKLYHQYVWDVLENSGELDKYQKNRADYYKQLRRLNSSSYINACWTVFTDYSPEKLDHIDYASEIDTVNEIVDYFMSRENIDRCWIDAADLLNDFRGPFFATGRWDERNNISERILRMAEAKKQLHLVGRLKHSLAWVYCYQDNYISAGKFTAEVLKIARDGIRDTNHKAEKTEENIAYRQIYYKSLIVHGLIALRQGQNYVLKGRTAIQQSKAYKTKDFSLGKELAFRGIANFRTANHYFEKARVWFWQANGVVSVDCEPETLVDQFYLALVVHQVRIV